MTGDGRKRKNGEAKESEAGGGLEDDIDALFAVPLAEFTAARNALAARLRHDGRGGEASRVKAIVKPSISAWVVNQLYWKHRESFDRLSATGQRFREVHASQRPGKSADMRAAGDARQKALSELSSLAAVLLRDAGHNPSSDTMRRITTTLEAMSAYASLPNAPSPGRLTDDVDPPGFEALTSLLGDGKMASRAEEPAPVAPFPISRRNQAPAGNLGELEDTRKTRIAAARVSLRDAEHVLNEARARAKSVDAALKKAAADAKDAEKHKLDAEESLQKAIAASDEAEQRARSVAAQAQETAKAVEKAERAVEKATRELQSLL